MTIHLPEVEKIPAHLRGLAQGGHGPAKGTRRPTRILMIVNMPNKKDTEIDACNFFGSLPGDYELIFRRPGNRWPGNLSQEHAATMGGYPPVSPQDICWCDGALLSGAPVETIPFNGKIRDSYSDNTNALDRLLEAGKVIIGWCWGGMVATNHLYGIEHRVPLQNGESKPLSALTESDVAQKIYGNYRQQVAAASGTNKARIELPVSRAARYSADQFNGSGLEIITHDDVSGPGILVDKDNNLVICLNHPEYQPDTLLYEYVRDGSKVLETYGVAYPIGGAAPDFLNLDRSDLQRHARAVHDTLASHNLAHAAPENYPLFDPAAQRAAKEAYVKDATDLFAHLFQKVGLLPAADCAPPRAHPGQKDWYMKAIALG